MYLTVRNAMSLIDFLAILYDFLHIRDTESLDTLFNFIP